MIAVIADDFTGAAEIAGLGWRHGLRADLLARGEKPTDADLVVYDADSRNCSPAEARRRVTRICRRLAANKPDWIFKKVDSVLRGNVIAEIEAALAVLRLKRSLVAPANPNAGRIICGGRYYIHGTPIHRTDFRNDPRHPRLSAKVIDLLGGPQKAPISILRAGTKSLRDGINVGEAAEFADVQHWAGLADEQTLAVGGADFFRALLLKHGHLIGREGETAKRGDGDMARRGNGETEKRRVRSPIRRFAGSPTLFVCGSLAESSRTFLAGCRTKGWPVLLMPDELLAGGEQCFQGRARHSVRAVVELAKAGAPGLSAIACATTEVARPTNSRLRFGVTNWSRQIIQALRRHPRVVVGIGRPLLSGKQTPLRLGRILTDTVRQVLSTARPGRVCVEGGATAALLLERMGWRRMSVEVEYATGVTGARPHRCPDLLLVCKPGSYAWPAALVD